MTILRIRMQNDLLFATKCTKTHLIANILFNRIPFRMLAIRIITDILEDPGIFGETALQLEININKHEIPYKCRIY